MKKLAVIFWTSTGNTEIMADAIIDGAKLSNGDVVKIPASLFDVNTVNEYNALAFGCPAMGEEQLDEYEFEPMFNAVLPLLQAKPIVLFGSYGWGDGEWMRQWEERCVTNGVTPIKTIIANYSPDDSVISELQEVGKSLVL